MYYFFVIYLFFGLYYFWCSWFQHMPTHAHTSKEKLVEMQFGYFILTEECSSQFQFRFPRLETQMSIYTLYMQVESVLRNIVQLFQEYVDQIFKAQVMLQCPSVTLGGFLYLQCSFSSLLAFTCPLTVGVQAYEMLLWYCHISGLEDNIAGINKDIKSFDARLKFAADIQSVAEVITVYSS